LHDGKPAADPEALMRSRFSAFALDQTAYLLRTWHPQTRPASIENEPEVRWVRLEVLGGSGGGLFDAEGTVEFRAHYREGGTPGVMAETSRFVRHDGQWVYWGPLE
jgi:SEC-C motif-containing protein